MQSKKNEIVSPKNVLTLKAAQRKLNRQGGGVECIADISRVGSTAIGNYGNQNHETHYPVDVLVNAEMELGDPIVTREMALMQGFLMVQMFQPSQDIQLSIFTAEFGKEVSDVFARIHEALSDGKLSPAEATEIRKELVEVSEVIANIDLYLQKKEEID